MPLFNDTGEVAFSGVAVEDAGGRVLRVAGCAVAFRTLTHRRHDHGVTVEGVAVWVTGHTADPAIPLVAVVPLVEGEYDPSRL